MPDCRHRSEDPLEYAGCPECGGMVTLIFECGLFGRCTVARIMPDPEDQTQMLPWCGNCPEREAVPQLAEEPS